MLYLQDGLPKRRFYAFNIFLRLAVGVLQICFWMEVVAPNLGYAPGSHKQLLEHRARGMNIKQTFLVPINLNHTKFLF